MDVLKKKVVQTRQEIEKAENKERYIRKLLRLTSERATLAEMEADGLKNRIKEMEKQIERVNARTERLGQGLTAKESEADDSEKDRKAMEGKEYDHSDQIALLETRCADMMRLVDEKEIRLEEAKFRRNEARAGLVEALKRGNAGEQKIAELEQEIERLCFEQYKLEKKGELLYKRKDYFESKIEDLQERYRNAIIRGDNDLGESKLLEKQKDRLYNELVRQKKRVAFLSRELEDALADLNQKYSG
uniref:Tropomyosin 3 n=2 Tax=Nematostella vectensis TaxID=45351 RepID=Q0ZDL9_NEMVE|nr:tropomyosin 3 [Nematostella vectensis]